MWCDDSCATISDRYRKYIVELRRQSNTTMGCRRSMHYTAAPTVTYLMHVIPPPGLNAWSLSGALILCHRRRVMHNPALNSWCNRAPHHILSGTSSHMSVCIAWASLGACRGDSFDLRPFPPPKTSCEAGDSHQYVDTVASVVDSGSDNYRHWKMPPRLLPKTPLHVIGCVLCV